MPTAVSPQVSCGAWCGLVVLRRAKMLMTKSSEEKEAVLGVFAALVRPLMRLAFEYGITAGEISGVIRRVYIKALEDRLLEQQRPTTDARLAAVAGLTRSDVAALREALRSGAPHSNRAYASMDQTSSVLNIWSTHPDFSGAYGLTLDLDLQTTEGSPRRSYTELVAIACPTVDPDTMLMQLIASGSVEIVDGQTVRCVSRAYLPKDSDVTRIERAGRFLGAAGGNFVHNLLRSEKEPPYFERSLVAAEVLSDSSRDSLLKETVARGEKLLFELDTFMTHLPPSAALETGKKYGVGIYFFEEPGVNGPTARSVNSSESRFAGEQPSMLEEIDVLSPKRRQE